MLITNYTPIQSTNPVIIQQNRQVYPVLKQDSATFENIHLDKKVLVDRKILKPNEDINSFLKNIASKVSNNSNNARFLTELLQNGFVSFSSSIYTDIENPASAIGIKLSKRKNTTQHCAQLEEYIAKGQGVGINFSEFSDPIKEIKEINSYFKFREPNLKRPPAGIALLNINHPKIMEFISLKDNKDYKNWCFDFSVVIDDNFLNAVDNNQNIELSDGTSKNAKEIYFKLLNSMLKSGEPGIIFSNEQDFICDCCAATQLKENEKLTLGQINLAKFYNPNTKKIDYDFLSASTNILCSVMKNIDPNAYISIMGYQDLLNYSGVNYGSEAAINILKNCLGTIKNQAIVQDIKVAISPTGTTSRLLKTSPSIEPKNNQNVTYYQEMDTLAAAQEFLDGSISKTINLKKNHTIQDIDNIIRYSKEHNIKGISVFPAQ